LSGSNDSSSFSQTKPVVKTAGSSSSGSPTGRWSSNNANHHQHRSSTGSPRSNSTSAYPLPHVPATVSSFKERDIAAAATVGSLTIDGKLCSSSISPERKRLPLIIRHQAKSNLPPLSSTC
jgi:hypothetical protein